MRLILTRPDIRQVALGMAALAIALSPALASAATQSTNTTVTATVQSVISLATGTAPSMSVTPTSSGTLTSTSQTVTVNSNNVLGYNLTVADSDATTTLVSGGNTIAASSNTTASPAALAVNTWGFAVGGLGTFDASYATETNSTTSTTKWAGMPASGSPFNIRSTSATATNEVTTVWYAVEVDSSKPNGTYTDTVTYTATTK